MHLLLCAVQGAFNDVGATFQKVSSKVSSLRGPKRQIAGPDLNAELETPEGFTDTDSSDGGQDGGRASQPAGSAAGKVKDTVPDSKVTS